MNLVGKGHVSLNLTLRRTFNLFANVRPCVSIQGFKTPYDDVNTVLIRENTEGEYSGIEHEVCTTWYAIDADLQDVPRSSMVSYNPSNSSHGMPRSVLLGMRSITHSQVEENGLRQCIRPTSCKSSQTLHIWPSGLSYLCRKMSDGMFLSACREVSKEFPDVTYDEDLLDRVCLQIVTNPRPYSDRVMVMPNLYGDILSDMCAGLIGGLGLTPSGNIGRVCKVPSVRLLVLTLTRTPPSSKLFTVQLLI
jgi:isocitrate dehydrogenase (NAD+)